MCYTTKAFSVLLQLLWLEVSTLSWMKFLLAIGQERSPPFTCQLPRLYSPLVGFPRVSQATTVVEFALFFVLVVSGGFI
jgi:hypothetical protein